MWHFGNCALDWLLLSCESKTERADGVEIDAIHLERLIDLLLERNQRIW